MLDAAFSATFVNISMAVEWGGDKGFCVGLVRDFAREPRLIVERSPKWQSQIFANRILLHLNPAFEISSFDKVVCAVVL